MTIKELRSQHRSVWETLQYIGLISKNIPAVIRTRLDGGKVSMQQDGNTPPFTGQAGLTITKGGLRNNEIPPEWKGTFKQEILPLLLDIEDINGLDLDKSGKIILHFNEGLLTTLS